jgi:hypothetical protein
MSKHTPGPWEVTRLIAENTQDNDYPGAEVSFREASDHPHDAAIQIWSERAEADAHLIAAAPDLLEALRDLRDACHSAYQRGSMDPEPFVRAGNVIAKAEGR